MSVGTMADAHILDAVRAIAREVAAPNADDVDRQGRFPVETIDALRQQRLLSAFTPTEFGGAGASVETIASCCRELGRACGASAMVFAMHQIQLATIVRHLEPGSWFENYLRDGVEEQRLIASVTSEVGTGGDMGSSIAAVTRHGDGQMTFEKQAPTVSYGRYADDLLTTLRRTPASEPGDQVAVLTRREQVELEQTGTWDVLGMRGTCSPGQIVRATFVPEQVMSTPFSQAAAETMVPISHVLWSHLWLGIAEDAFDRARAFVRATAKRKPGEPLPGAARLSALLSQLTMLRAEVRAGLDDFVCRGGEGDREWLLTMSAALRFNSLTTATSESSAEVCRGALDVCGIVGFKNDTPFSVGRHVRDSMSGAMMIANERIHQTNAGLLLIAKEV